MRAPIELFAFRRAEASYGHQRRTKLRQQAKLPSITLGRMRQFCQTPQSGAELGDCLSVGRTSHGLLTGTLPQGDCILDLPGFGPMARKDSRVRLLEARESFVDRPGDAEVQLFAPALEHCPVCAIAVHSALHPHLPPHPT